MLTTSKSLYYTTAIRNLEKLATEQFNISQETLMQRAGFAAFRELRRKWPHANNIVVVCGKGNNGGDGYVLAHYAQAAGFEPLVLTLADPDKLTGVARAAYEGCVSAQVKILPFTPEKLKTADAIVDAIFGIGLSGSASNDYASAISAINSAAKPVLAIDIPSGLEADTGVALGEAVRANLTVTFIGNKVGLYISEGIEYSGEVICDDLDLPGEAFAAIPATLNILELTELLLQFPQRKSTANKGNFGHLLAVGGDHGMSGAVRMAAEAAARVGAGVVTVATRPEHILGINISRPELMCHGIKYSLQLMPLLKRATVVVVGPGIGTSLWGKSLWWLAVKSKKPIILDADGLNILAKKTRRRDNWILTPHPGEAARLLKTSVAKIQADRIAAAKKIQQKFGGICVLKGAGTIIAGPTQTISVCVYGNPGMASGGMGDVLSGVIGGLVAEGLALEVAACLGVCLHAFAGDLVAKEYGKEGMLAMDLIPVVRELISRR